MTSLSFSLTQAMQNARRTTTFAESVQSANNVGESVATHHRQLVAMLVAAIGQLNFRLPDLRPIYRLEPRYFEVARMAREMEHL